MTVLEKPTTQQKDPDPAPSRRLPAITPVRALAALVALAALAALFFGGSWLLALNDDGLELSAEREAVLVDARQAAINLNSHDHQNVGRGLDLWEQIATGPLLDEIRSNRAAYEQVITQSKLTTVATVPDAAVAELDVRTGTARVLAAVDVENRSDPRQPTVTRQRIELEMIRTDQGWKANRVAPVHSPS